MLFRIVGVTEKGSEPPQAQISGLELVDAVADVLRGP